MNSIYIFQIAVIIAGIISLIKQMHLLQLESYYFIGFVNRNPYKKPFLSSNYLFFITDILAILIYFSHIPYNYLISALLISLNIFDRKKDNIKPPVFTARFKTHLFLSVVILIILSFFHPLLPFLRVLTPIVIILSHLLLHPYDEFMRNRFKKKSNKKIEKLKSRGMKVIGITGSYGKTSVKFILSHILSSQYKVVFTPSSYNTPMGISKFVNENMNDISYDIFVCEMGARRKGDIKELCELVMPDVGVLTAIGPQHLETFGSIENIKNEKLNLYKYVKNVGGKVFYNNCNEILHEELKNEEIAIGGGCKGVCEISMKNIDKDGMLMDVKIGDKLFENVKTVLIGKSNIINISLSATIAYNMGIDEEKIVNAIKTLKPVDHRLQIIKSSSEFLIIDDAFNANVEGVKNAMETLKYIKANRRIVITPGIVEGGEKEYELNKEIGVVIGETADIVFVVKGRGKDRVKGLIDGIGDKSKIVEIDSLKEFNTTILPLLKKGDVVIFENDIPDNF